MTATTDVLNALEDDWWSEAAQAETWKSKFELIERFWELLTGVKDQTGQPPLKIENGEKAGELMKYFTAWLANENHAFIRLYIMKILPTLINSFDKKTLAKSANAIAETIFVEQWREKRSKSLVTPVLLSLWQKVNFNLSAEEIRPHIITAINNKQAPIRMSVWDFLSKCTMFKSRSKQIEDLLFDNDLIVALGKQAIGDREGSVREAASKFIIGVQSLKIKKLSKSFKEVSEKVKKDKRGGKAMTAAQKQFEIDKNSMMDAVNAVDNKGKKKRKKNENKS